MENNIILSPISLQDWQNVFDRSLNTAIEKHFKDFISPAPQEKYLTRKETAALLNVSLPTLNEYTKRNLITGYRFGVRVLYKQSEIEAALTKINYGRGGHD
jgi:excisionase family DNA binding protein